MNLKTFGLKLKQPTIKKIKSANPNLSITQSIIQSINQSINHSFIHS